MRAFHMILTAETSVEPRRVDFQAESADHAFQVARNESDGVHIELWEGGRLLARMTKSGANIWKLHSSSGTVGAEIGVQDGRAARNLNPPKAIRPRPRRAAARILEPDF